MLREDERDSACALTTSENYENNNIESEDEGESESDSEWDKDMDKNLLKCVKELKLLHYKYGHLSYGTLEKLFRNNSIEDINTIITTKNKNLIREGLKVLKKRNCKVCLKGKMTRLPMRGQIDHKVTKPMDMLVADVMGPMKVETLDGYKYILVIIDVFTRFPFITLMKTKGDATREIIEVITECQTQKEKKLKRLHTDGGKEFVNNEMSEFLKKNGTIHTTTTPHTPQHNGLVERANRTIMEMIRSMLFQSDAYLPLWGYAAHATAFILSMSLTTASKTKTPLELWTDSNKVHVSVLHVFGCDVFYHIHKNDREGKMNEQAKEAIFVCSQNLGYYRLYDVDKNKFVVSRDVRFDECSFKQMRKLKKKMKNEYMRTHTHKNRISNDDDALPDHLTDDMIKQLFPTDQLEETHNDSSAQEETT